MEWLVGLEVAVALLALVVVVPLLGLYLRRRWLSAKGGVFDCALRLHNSGPGTGWATGLCRYEGERLEWFRTFSLSVRPRLVLERDQTAWLGRRGPEAAEAVVLFSEDQILRLENRAGGGSRVWELAMHPSSATGLMSWLEAAPPGGDRYSGLESAPQ